MKPDNSEPRQHKEQVSRRAQKQDPLLSLCGSGKQLWADEHADEYVQRLREDWK